MTQERERQAPVESAALHGFGQDEAADEEKDNGVGVGRQHLRGRSDAENDRQHGRQERGHRHRQRLGDPVGDGPDEHGEQRVRLPAEPGHGPREDDDEQ